jgi:putative pyruvate formate lyase activating enzyme
MTDQVVAARAALHMWEEPCISGKKGSGAVFFSGCPLQCVFCQNRPIALGKAGKEISVQRLADIFLELRDQGANNINLVTPTHFVPQIIEAVRRARAAGLSIPIVYNTGSYENPETISMLEGTADIFLPDLKFRDPKIAERYAGAPDYFETACRAIGEMVRIAGEPEFNSDGIMQKGVIVRHMILPGHTKDSEDIIRYLHESYGSRIFISIMNQYTPMEGIGKDYPELARKVTKREYDKVLSYAIDLGVENAYYQSGGTAKEGFIPAFDGEGI